MRQRDQTCLVLSLAHRKRRSLTQTARGISAAAQAHAHLLSTACLCWLSTGFVCCGPHQLPRPPSLLPLSYARHTLALNEALNAEYATCACLPRCAHTWTALFEPRRVQAHGATCACSGDGTRGGRGAINLGFSRGDARDAGTQ